MCFLNMPHFRCAPDSCHSYVCTFNVAVARVWGTLDLWHSIKHKQNERLPTKILILLMFYKHATFPMCARLVPQLHFHIQCCRGSNTGHVDLRHPIKHKQNKRLQTKQSFLLMCYMPHFRCAPNSSHSHISKVNGAVAAVSRISCSNMWFWLVFLARMCSQMHR